MSHADVPPTADESTRPGRPWGLWAAVAGSLSLASFFLVMAGLSLTGGHGEFSWHVAIGLIVWALVVVGAALAMARRYWWSRGPIVATGVLHLAAFVQSTSVQPWAVLGVLVALMTVVGAVLPSTREALRIPLRIVG